MATIAAAVTDLARDIRPKMLGGLLAHEIVSYFKIAEGGWVDPGGGKEPRDPFAHVAEIDVDAVVDAGRAPIDQRYAADERFVFQKSFVGGDITFTGTSTLRCRCFLDFAEANDDGFGNDPEFWELAIFDADDNMLVYGTFPQQTKNVGVQITNFFNITY